MKKKIKKIPVINRVENKKYKIIFQSESKQVVNVGGSDVGFIIEKRNMFFLFFVSSVFKINNRNFYNGVFTTYLDIIIFLDKNIK